MEIFGLDFETYGSVDLRRHGLDRYVSDPHFRPLIACIEQYAGNPWEDPTSYSLDFVRDYDNARAMLNDLLRSHVKIAAHNASFELAVITKLGLNITGAEFVDSAVVARAAGGGSKLEAAAPQLLGADKMEQGSNLIKLFSIPGKYQQEGDLAFNPQIIEDHPDEWNQFYEYCMLDARLSAALVAKCSEAMLSKEHLYQDLTLAMNQKGWPVDVKIVNEMQERYLDNLEEAHQVFIDKHNAKDLNLNSLKQLKEWCADRGVKATSFDEKSVARMLRAIDKKLAVPGLTPEQDENYSAVHDLLLTKQTLGGSSLKKLQVILDTVSHDGRLRDQYLHCGAGQTLRTTGRSVQMQNLKRIGEPANMEDLLGAKQLKWDNQMLAENLRQVFTSSHVDGRLIVGDFASVESRGLAWAAGETWKTDAYRRGDDLYKLLAAKIFGTTYDEITKSQRQTGKVGELSCGYGAGPGAVRDFAANMGVAMTDGEAAKLVFDWREANPKVVALWSNLDDMLQAVVDQDPVRPVELSDGYFATIINIDTPKSLINQVGVEVKSVALTVHDEKGSQFLYRVFHGCYRRGRNIGYFKPSDRKTGNLWSNTFVNPKTKQTQHYELYGGKLAGILTQSLCREIFFAILLRVGHAFRNTTNVDLIGQFHDEIVLDWTPEVSGLGDSSLLLMETTAILQNLMTHLPEMPSFPMGAEVKADYRYTK